MSFFVVVAIAGMLFLAALAVLTGGGVASVVGAAVLLLLLCVAVSEIAEARGVPQGVKCVSPSHHSVFSTPREFKARSTRSEESHADRG